MQLINAGLTWLGLEPIETPGHQTKLSRCLMSEPDDYKELIDTETTEWMWHVADYKKWKSAAGQYPPPGGSPDIQMRTTEDIDVYVEGKIFTRGRVRAFLIQNTDNRGKPLEGYDDTLVEEDDVFIVFKSADYKDKIEFVEGKGFVLRGGINKGKHPFAEFPIEYSPANLKLIFPSDDELEAEYRKIAQQNGCE